MIYRLNEADRLYVTDFVERLETYKQRVSAYNEKNGLPDKLFGVGDSRRFRLIGYGAEYAFSRLFDLHFNDEIGVTGDGGNDFTLPNLLTVQIKCRTQRNRDFAVMPDLSDFNSDIGVLMWPLKPEISPLYGFEVVGWVSKVSFMQLAIRGKFKGERLYVRYGDMHNSETLGRVINASP